MTRHEFANGPIIASALRTPTESKAATRRNIIENAHSSGHDRPTGSISEVLPPGHLIIVSVAIVGAMIRNHSMQARAVAHLQPGLHQRRL